MLKERAASALKHGLPVPTPRLPKQAVEVRSSAPSLMSSRAVGVSPANRRMPLAVKLLALGLGLLGLVYGLSVFRDHKPSVGPASSDAALK